MFKLQPFHSIDTEGQPPVHFWGLRLALGRKVRRYFDIGVGYAKSTKKVST